MNDHNVDAFISITIIVCCALTDLDAMVLMVDDQYFAARHGDAVRLVELAVADTFATELEQIMTLRIE